MKRRRVKVRKHKRRLKSGQQTIVRRHYRKTKKCMASKEIKRIHRCIECNEVLSFQELCETNYNISKEQLKIWWESPSVEFYCCRCFSQEEGKRMLKEVMGMTPTQAGKILEKDFKIDLDIDIEEMENWSGADYRIFFKVMENREEYLHLRDLISKEFSVELMEFNDLFILDNIHENIKTGYSTIENGIYDYKYLIKELNEEGWNLNQNMDTLNRISYTIRDANNNAELLTWKLKDMISKDFEDVPSNSEKRDFSVEIQSLLNRLKKQEWIDIYSKYIIYCKTFHIKVDSARSLYRGLTEFSWIVKGAEK